MKNRLLGTSLAITLGVSAGSYSLLKIQELWFSIMIFIVVSTSAYGIISYRNIIFSKSDSVPSIWNFISTILIVGVIFTPQASGVIETPFIYETILLLFGVLLSGATIGIAIAR